MMPTRDSIATHDLPVRILDGSPDAIFISDHAARYGTGMPRRSGVFGFDVQAASAHSCDYVRLALQRASDGSDPTIVQQVGTPTATAGADVVVIGD